MFDSSVERFGGRIVGESEDVATPNPGETTRARDDQEAKRAHAAEEIGVCPFARAGLALGERVKRIEGPPRIEG